MRIMNTRKFIIESQSVKNKFEWKRVTVYTKTVAGLGLCRPKG
jgi:hypothetical protein